MTRFLHSADWQIGKPYLSVRDDSKRFKLQQERLLALGRIRDVARNEAAEFVLVAGDLFDSPAPQAAAVLEVLEAIGAMGVPVLVIPGNHDHGAPGTVWHRDDFQRYWSQMAPNLQVLLQREPIELEQAVILPCPLLRNQDSSDPTLWLRSFDWSSLPADKPRIVLDHVGVLARRVEDVVAAMQIMAPHLPAPGPQGRPWKVGIVRDAAEHGASA